MYSGDELLQRSREGYFGVYFPSCEARGEINTKITFEWALKQFVTRVHTLFFIRLIESINEDKNDDLYTSFPCLTRSVFVLLVTSLSIADDATMTRQLWHDYVDSDIDFINGDIHDRSCTKTTFAFSTISNNWDTQTTQDKRGIFGPLNRRSQGIRRHCIDLGFFPKHSAFNICGLTFEMHRNLAKF